MVEIVGAKIGDIITNKPRVILDSIIEDKEIEWLDRQRMKIMAAADLGSRWVNMSNGKTLFLIDGDGNCHLPKEFENGQ